MKDRHPRNNYPDLQLRNLTQGDFHFCVRLINQAGWNQIEADWHRLLALDADGCFIVEKDGQRAGTIVFTRFASTVWISMVLVDMSYRGQGIGQWMFGQIIQKLRNLSIQTIRLDATEMGMNLYRKYGFEEEYGVIRFVKDEGKVKAEVDAEMRQAGMEDLDVLTGLDYKLTDTDRRSLLQHLILEDTAKVCIDQITNGEFSGFTGMRKGRTRWQIGPCMATDPSAGIRLLEIALADVSGEKVIIDIPADNKSALDWARNHQFTEERRFIRMYTGDKPDDRQENIFASFGPEKG